jgi:hypothetical protein
LEAGKKLKTLSEKLKQKGLGVWLKTSTLSSKLRIAKQK